MMFKTLSDMTRQLSFKNFESKLIQESNKIVDFDRNSFGVTI